MKKYLIIGLIIAVIASMVVVPILRNDRGNAVSEDEEFPALFSFKENLATKWNDVIPITFEVKSDEVVKIDLVYNDSIFQTWTNPKGKITYQFNAGFYGLGTKSISLLSTLKNGETFSDDRLVRIVSDISPESWKVKIAKTFPHNSTHFIQGLEWNNGTLYEGTGDPGKQGKTLVGMIDLASGNYTKKMGLDANYFGEGITILKDKIYQLTYTEGKCFVYDKNSLTLVKDMIYQGEGWGLCNDGEFLYMSNGSERLTKRNPADFSILETIEVYDNNGPIANLNELEYVDGLIYANVWQTNAIIVIQPENGKVLATINCAELANLGQNGGDVLNGIAYSPANKMFYLTGKYWNKLFEVSFEKPVL
ncbi:MAG: glutaminyl-peptide cyclotransferase [Crocinitomicaceae bacterium]